MSGTCSETTYLDMETSFKNNFPRIKETSVHKKKAVEFRMRVPKVSAVYDTSINTLNEQINEPPT